MTTADDSELPSVLRTLAEQEQTARDELQDLRAQLSARDERFAALEAEMWAGFEAREVRHRELIEQREHELARLGAEMAAVRREVDRFQQEAGTVAELTEQNFLLRVRLEHILSSPPGRLYTKLMKLPGLDRLQRSRDRRYEAAVARKRPS